MNASKIVGIVLIVVSLAVGYIGANKIADSTKEVNFLGINISASDESGKQQGFIYLGLAIVLLGAGVYAMKKGK